MGRKGRGGVEESGVQTLEGSGQRKQEKKVEEKKLTNNSKSVETNWMNELKKLEEKLKNQEENLKSSLKDEYFTFQK